jgi:hypothetical protein
MQTCAHSRQTLCASMVAGLQKSHGRRARWGVGRALEAGQSNPLRAPSSKWQAQLALLHLPWAATNLTVTGVAPNQPYLSLSSIPYSE